MANSLLLSPFILSAEGGYVDNPVDKGGATNKGITWNTWQEVFPGLTRNQFVIMAPDDWNKVFTQKFWDFFQGDNINSQRVANMLGDWVWTSWTAATMSIQDILKIQADGIIGKQSIAAINGADEPTLYNALIEARKDFYNLIVQRDPTQQIFLEGWQNRINNLIKYNLSLNLNT